MVEQVKKVSLIFFFAGLGGLLRQLAVLQFGDIGLLGCNYGAVYGLVYSTHHLFRSKSVSPSLKVGLSVGFFGGLSTIAPIFMALATAIEQSDWWRLTGLVVCHIFGGYVVALLANSRAVKRAGN